MALRFLALSNRLDAEGIPWDSQSCQEGWRWTWCIEFSFMFSFRCFGKSIQLEWPLSNIINHVTLSMKPFQGLNVDKDTISNSLTKLIINLPLLVSSLSLISTQVPNPHAILVPQRVNVLRRLRGSILFSLHSTKSESQVRWWDEKVNRRQPHPCLCGAYSIMA